MISRTYVNGVIAAKEKYFLGEKLLRLTETDAASALRALKESGFGGDSESAENGNFSTDEAETLIAAEEAKTNAFIREYAGSEAERRISRRKSRARKRRKCLLRKAPCR